MANQFYKKITSTHLNNIWEWFHMLKCKEQSFFEMKKVKSLIQNTLKKIE